MNIYELINQSLNETMSRTLLTSVTTLLALFSLYFLGGEVLRGFWRAEEVKEVGGGRER